MPSRLGDDERDVLRGLAHYADLSGVEPDSRWARPLDIGGHSRSRHSYILSKLIRWGLVEARQRSPLAGRRGSKEYRITDQGREALSAERP